MTVARLPAHLEVSGIVRAVEAVGGFAMILQCGERDAGAILVVTQDRGRERRLWERLPNLDGQRVFSLARAEADGEENAFSAYLERRQSSDPDSWVIEVDVPNGERFIDCAVQ